MSTVFCAHGSNQIGSVSLGKIVPPCLVSFNYARGMGKLTPAKYRGVGEQSEKEVFTVVVEELQADEIFEYIYNVADINRPHGGLIYMQKLMQSTNSVLPDVIEER